MHVLLNAYSNDAVSECGVSIVVKIICIVSSTFTL